MNNDNILKKLYVYLKRGAWFCLRAYYHFYIKIPLVSLVDMQTVSLLPHVWTKQKKNKTISLMAS